jgi:hypothetical protein
LSKQLRINRSLVLSLALISLAAAMVACMIDIGGPDPPGSAMPIEEDSAEQVRQTWQSAIQSAALEGQVRVILNERQLTGFLAERFESSQNPLLSDPQVYLRQGAIQIYGIVQRAMLSGSILISVRPVVTEQGDIHLDVSEASIGPVPAPAALRDTISALLTEAFTGSVGTLATGIRITALVIADGEMAIVGELR